MVEDVSHVVLGADVKCEAGTGQQFEVAILVSTRGGNILKVAVERIWTRFSIEEVDAKLHSVVGPGSDIVHGPIWDWVVTKVDGGMPPVEIL